MARQLAKVQRACIRRNTRRGHRYLSSSSASETGSESSQLENFWVGVSFFSLSILALTKKKAAVACQRTRAGHLYNGQSAERGVNEAFGRYQLRRRWGVYGASAKAAKFLPRGGPPIDNHHASHLGESPLSGTDTTHIHTLPTHAGSPGLAVSGENLRKTGVTTDRRAR
ncbi:hypothetical protein MRX96_002666 [Rhipicephalus microplus]